MTEPVAEWAWEIVVIEQRPRIVRVRTRGRGVAETVREIGELDLVPALVGLCQRLGFEFQVDEGLVTMRKARAPREVSEATRGKMRDSWTPERRREQAERLRERNAAGIMGKGGRKG